MSNRRAAIVAGWRTPFARSGTVFRDLTAVGLAKVCLRELVERTEVDPASIGTVVMGQVVPSVKAPNLAREAALGRAARFMQLDTDPLTRPAGRREARA